jgi:Flp pilus assembly protein TadD
MNGKAVSLIGLREFDEATQLLRHATTIAPDNAVVSGNLHRISPMG